MLKFLARDCVVFDTETVPDVEAGRRIYGATEPDIRETVNDDVIRGTMWRDASGFDEQTNPRPFLKPILTQVVSMALVRRTVRPEDGSAKIELKVLSGDEAQIIRRFMSGVAGSPRMQMVGFNSEGFDLPLLIQRALVHGLSVPDFCKRPDKPWEGRDLFARYTDWHIDLMQELGGFGRSSPSLSEACAAMNILGGAKDITGADVLDLYLAGEHEVVNRYCAKDAVRHFLILLRLCVLAGHMTKAQAEADEAEVTRQLEALTPAEATV